LTQAIKDRGYSEKPSTKNHLSFDVSTMQELSFFWKVSNLIFDKRFPEEKTDQEQVPQDHFKYPFHSKFHFLLLHLKVTLLFAKSG